MSESWLAAARKRLESFTDLKPNWDSYGAKAIEAQAIIKAALLLIELEKAGAPEPSVVPTKDGYVELEWDFPDDEWLTATVLPDGTIAFGWGDDWHAISAPGGSGEGRTSNWRNLLRFMPAVRTTSKGDAR